MKTGIHRMIRSSRNMVPSEDAKFASNDSLHDRANNLLETHRHKEVLNRNEKWVSFCFKRMLFKWRDSNFFSWNSNKLQLSRWKLQAVSELFDIIRNSLFITTRYYFNEKAERRVVRYKIFRRKHNSTYRPRAERLVHVVDVVIDVIVVVEVIAGGVSGVVVACMMIRVVAIVVLVMLVQHHRGEHVECLTAHRKHVERARSFENAPTSLLLVSPHDSSRPLQLTELKYRAFNSLRQSTTNVRKSCVWWMERPSNFL